VSIDNAEKASGRRYINIAGPTAAGSDDRHLGMARAQPWAMRTIGSSDQPEQLFSGSRPAQVSNSCTASAPAPTWLAR
jgi:hypothetical protein